jgi:hypothetical protein
MIFIQVVVIHGNGNITSTIKQFVALNEQQLTIKKKK